MMNSLATWTSRGALVDGAWRMVGGSSVSSTSPIDGRHVVTKTHGHAELVDTAVQAARRAQRTWRRAPIAERMRTLDAFARVLSERAEEAAALIVAEMGKPLSEARGEAAAQPRLPD